MYMCCQRDLIKEKESAVTRSLYLLLVTAGGKELQATLAAAKITSANLQTLGPTWPELGCWVLMTRKKAHAIRNDNGCRINSFLHFFF